MKNKVIQKTLTLATQDTDHINRSARRVILGMRKKLLNDPTRRIINALAALILGFALGLASLSGEAWAEGSEVVFGVTVPTTPVLQITLYDNNGNEITSGSSSTMSVTPQMANAAFNTSSISVNVGTSSLAGYNLTMYASDTSLKSGDNEIPTLGDGEFSCTAEQSATNDDACTFTENAWGYKLSTASAFGAIPAQAAPATLNSNDAPTNGITTTVNFGSRVNAQQPAGTYTTTINFIATANPTSMTINDITNLQDFATLGAVDYADVLDSMEMETNYTKTDSRDGQEYTIAKLADNKIWMTKNLNLAGGTEIESTKSDVPANYTLPTANNFQSGNKLPASATAGFDDDTKAFVYNTNNNTDTCTGSGCYSYYSWTAATAGSGLSITTDNTSALYSICPKGWKLPSTYNGTDSTAANFDFRALMIAYGGSYSVQTYNTSSNPTGATMYRKIGPTTTVPKFLLTGYYNGGSFYDGGSYGSYWSSTSNNSTIARYLYFNSAYVYSANFSYRRGGFAIRCVLGTSLQQFSSRLSSSISTGDQMRLYDNRDMETYTVGKLADNNVWFLDNLRLDPTVTTLTPSNTNVTSTPTATFTNKTSGWSGDAAYTNAWYNLASKDSTQSYGSGSNKIGGYYNFCAASAGSYCMDSSSGSGDATQDLCPSGWRMPTGGNGGEYATFTQAITGTSGDLSGTDRTNFMNAAHIALSGYFWDASAGDQGSGGYFWSSTFNSTSNMYRLSLNGSTVYPTDDGYRNSGFPIRCILQ